MSAAPLPQREAARLAALDAHRLLDTPAERSYDDLVGVAAQLFDVPIALVSLVDRERQWFKARFGLDACETPRENAFCAWAILEPTQVMVVEDARWDERFAANPLVLGAPHIRFYAGATLVDGEGFALGTLCVIDTRPRQFDARQRAALSALARQVVSQIELRRSLDQVTRLGEQLLTSEESLRESNRYLGALQHMGELASSGAKPALVLERALEFTRRFAGAELGALAVAGQQPEGESQLAVVATSGEPGSLLEWLPACTAWVCEQELGPLRTHSDEQSTWLTMGFGKQDAARGALVLSCAAGRTFESTDLETLRALTERLGLLHDQARLERLRALDAARLAESEQRFRNLSDRLPAMIWMGDSKGTCIYVNRSWLDFTGRTFEQEVGGGWLESVHAPDRERLRLTFATAFKDRAPFECEFRIPRRDGELRWVVTSGQARWSDEREFVGYMGSCLDITERVAHEEEARSSRDDALEVARAKTQFLANMSHEIRTPLNGVIGMLELLLADDLQGEQYHMVQVARASGEALLTLLNDMLDISRLESGRLDLEHIAFDPRELADSVVSLFQARAREKGIALELGCAADLPAAVLGDPTRVRQVLTNLVGNAVKFTSEGGVRVLLAPTASPGARPALEFAVEDSGPGLPAGAEEWVFNSFSQADASTTRRFGGSGLGLAIASQLVGLMGGELGFTPGSPRGTRFAFTLPLELTQEAPVAALPSRTELRGAFVDGQGLRVLVAEDNPVNREVITRMLRLRRYEVEFADDGLAAVEAATRSTYNLILMDGHMPELDGCEATRRIRSSERARGADRTPIVALTASAQPEDHRRCLDAGMDAVLTKPVRMLDLDEALERWVARSLPF